MVRIFREGPGPNALAIAMAGVRLGERQLLIGDDGDLFAELARKVGLTGRSLAMAGTDSSANRLRRAASNEGVLLEVDGGLPEIAADDQSFDVVLVDAGPTLFSLDAAQRSALACSVFRVLRSGGRVLVSERGTPILFGLTRLPLRGVDAFRSQGGATAFLESGGFRSVRLIAEREGQRFTEGRKP